MTLDGFLTLLALLVAIYTLIPRHKKELLKLGMGLQILAAVFAFLLVLYCHFYENLINVSDLEPSGLPSLLENTISPSKFSFIVVLCWGRTIVCDLQILFVEMAFPLTHIINNCKRLHLRAKLHRISNLH